LVVASSSNSSNSSSSNSSSSGSGCSGGNRNGAPSANVENVNNISNNSRRPIYIELSTFSKKKPELILVLPHKARGGNWFKKKWVAVGQKTYMKQVFVKAKMHKQYTNTSLQALHDDGGKNSFKDLFLRHNFLCVASGVVNKQLKYYFLTQNGRTKHYFLIELIVSKSKVDHIPTFIAQIRMEDDLAEVFRARFNDIFRPMVSSYGH